MDQHLISDKLAIMKFIMAGKAIFTLHNEDSNVRFTYKVEQADDKSCYFVSLLTGCDNSHNYSYIGILRDGNFYSTKKTKVKVDSPSFRGADWLFNKAMKSPAQLPAPMKFYHIGCCGRCGRPLTVPASIINGIGPECERLMAQGR